MKTNYFLRIASSIERFGYRIKNLFRSPGESARNFFELSTCLAVGNLDKFDEFFNKKYDPASFILLVKSAVENGKLETFLKLEEKAIELKKIHQEYREPKEINLNPKFKHEIDGDFYGTALSFSMGCDNKDVVEYLIKNGRINIWEISDLDIMQASTSKSDKLLHYILFDLNIKPNNELIKILKCDANGITHTETLALIEKRDLMVQLDKELEQNKNNKPKPKKL